MAKKVYHEYTGMSYFGGMADLGAKNLEELRRDIYDLWNNDRDYARIEYFGEKNNAVAGYILLLRDLKFGIWVTPDGIMRRFGPSGRLGKVIKFPETSDGHIPQYRLWPPKKDKKKLWTFVKEKSKNGKTANKRRK